MEGTKVRADKLQPGNSIKIGPLWFEIDAVIPVPYEKYPVFFMRIILKRTSTPLVVHKYTLHTIR